MAISDPTWISHNLIGNMREDIGEFTYAGVTAGAVKMRLSWVEFAEVVPAHYDDPDRLAKVYKNANTTTEDDTDYGGQVYLANLTSGQPVRIRAIGW